MCCCRFPYSSSSMSNSEPSSFCFLPSLCTLFPDSKPTLLAPASWDLTGDDGGDGVGEERSRRVDQFWRSSCDMDPWGDDIGEDKSWKARCASLSAGSFIVWCVFGNLRSGSEYCVLKQEALSSSNFQGRIRLAVHSEKLPSPLQSR